MGSKEVMVTAPLVVLIYDRLFLAGGFVQALRSRWPIHAGLACTLAIIPALLLTTVAWRSKSGAGIEGLTVWDNLKTQADVIVHYLRLAVWPSGLAIDYDDWPIARSLLMVWPQALLVLWFLGLSMYGLWRGHPLAFIGAWFFVILAPTSSFLPLGTEIAGERRMYLPTIAVVALAVIVGREVLRRLTTRFAWRPSSVRLSGSLAVIAVACAMIGATVFRNDDYRTALSIYSDAARKRPGNARAMMNVGVALAQNGDNDGAQQAFEQALERKPNYPDAHYNLGAILFQSSDPDAALPHFAAAIRGRPTWPLPYYRNGEIFALKGQVNDARQTLEKARSLAAQAGQQYLVEEIDAKIASLPSTTTPREPA
jgi:tetratricopeptide (TPR) repeat protein